MRFELNEDRFCLSPFFFSSILIQLIDFLLPLKNPNNLNHARSENVNARHFVYYCAAIHAALTLTLGLVEEQGTEAAPEQQNDWFSLRHDYNGKDLESKAHFFPL